ncbi:MAG: DUF4392 domain-containing protein [candidate division NC10 bacterium]|nr:DUF4392 domain-containing protein [candidate division NC10 bacterium]
MSIEDIILAHDQRGISALRSHLPVNYCEEAARLLGSQQGTVFITTGFYILKAQAAETDGPPGAIAMGRALEQLGRRVVYVTDEPAAGMMRALTGSDRVLLFPTVDSDKSQQHASQLIRDYQPSLLIAIERCGRTKDGTYLNMADREVTPFTAKIDALFESSVPSIGIGDGGNEIGMGNLADVIPNCPRLPALPCVTRATQLVIASVANWGAYGLLAALSRMTKRNLLPSVEEQRSIVEELASLGAVDGTTGSRGATVDGHSLETNSEVLHHLHQFVSSTENLG